MHQWFLFILLFSKDNSALERLLFNIEQIKKILPSGLPIRAARLDDLLCVLCE
jgi:hypothetical protein